MNNNKNNKDKYIFFRKLKEIFINIFKPKSKITTYLLGNNQVLTIGDGSMPSKPLSNLVEKTGSSIDTIVTHAQQAKESNQIKNPPEIYSTSLATTTPKKSKQNPKLLNLGTPSTEYTIPEEISTEPKKVLTTDIVPNQDISSKEQSMKKTSLITEDSTQTKNIDSSQTEPHIEDDFER